MARFYTHLANGDGFHTDEDGLDFPDAEAARGRAIVTGADIIADELKSGCDHVKVTLFIEDADHVRIATIPMSGRIDKA